MKHIKSLDVDFYNSSFFYDITYDDNTSETLYLDDDELYLSSQKVDRESIAEWLESNGYDYSKLVDMERNGIVDAIIGKATDLFNDESTIVLERGKLSLYKKASLYIEDLYNAIGGSSVLSLAEYIFTGDLVLIDLPVEDVILKHFDAHFEGGYVVYKHEEDISVDRAYDLI